MIDCSQLASQLISKVTLFDGTPVKFHLAYQKVVGIEYIDVFLTGEHAAQINRNKIGELRFLVGKNILSQREVLCITGMDNFTSQENIKRKVFGVGTLLHEIAFRLSVARGCEGRVELSVARNSGLFHKKSGFVTSNPDMNERLDAENKLRKEMLNVGKRFDVSMSAMANGCAMFLPPDVIQKKHQQFFTSRSTSPQTVTFFNAKATAIFQSSRMTNLVRQGKLAVSDAKDLEHGLLLPESRDPIAWNAILSPNGLWLMYSGYLPAYYAYVYFSQSNSEKLVCLVSDEALDLFSKNLVAWQDFVNLSVAHVKFILSPEGIRLLHKSHITIDMVHLLPYEVVTELNNNASWHLHVYQAFEFNLISFEYVRDKFRENKDKSKDFWRELSNEIHARNAVINCKVKDVPKEQDTLQSPVAAASFI